MDLVDDGSVCGRKKEKLDTVVSLMVSACTYRGTVVLWGNGNVYYPDGPR